MPIVDFDPEYLSQLRETVRIVLREPEFRMPGSGVKAVPRGWYVAATPGGGIPGMTNDTPGSAECAVYRMNIGTGVLEQAKTHNGQVSINQAVYHLGEQAVAGNTWIQVTQDTWGQWYTVWEDCPEDADALYASDILNDSGVGGTPKP